MKSVDTKAKKRNFELHKSTLFQEFEAERQEILKHKWLESEKAGHDIGFEFSLLRQFGKLLAPLFFHFAL